MLFNKNIITYNRFHFNRRRLPFQLTSNRPPAHKNQIPGTRTSALQKNLIPPRTRHEKYTRASIPLLFQDIASFSLPQTFIFPHPSSAACMRARVHIHTRLSLSLYRFHFTAALRTMRKASKWIGNFRKYLYMRKIRRLCHKDTGDSAASFPFLLAFLS